MGQHPAHFGHHSKQWDIHMCHIARARCPHKYYASLSLAALRHLIKSVCRQRPSRHSKVGPSVGRVDDDEFDVEVTQSLQEERRK